MSLGDEPLIALIKSVNELGDGVQESKKAHREAAKEVLPTARDGVNSQSGTLKKSGRVGATKRNGTVRFGSAKVPYAGANHFGHANRPQGGYVLPNPFLYDAGDKRAAEVREVYLSRLDTLQRQRF